MKDLLQIRGLSLDRFNAVLDRADEYYDIVTAGKKPFPKLKDRSVITLFYENSTRTRTSFESAAKYLGAEVVNISVGASSVQKGESLKDTALTRKVEKYPFVPQGDADRKARCERVLEIQAQGLAKRMRHTGSKHLVVGLSGGLDSALALLVMCKAAEIVGLDRKSITALTMPCFGTTKRTRSNAEKLALSLGVSFGKVDITKTVARHLKDIGHDGVTGDVAFENAQARERTQVLMDFANRTGGLVVGTGDLSELALGWATYNGDHMSMYGVNGSVPKTLVRHLVRYYAENVAGLKARRVLEDILDTPVSPELIPAKDGEISQKTEEIVGPYELHDFFLYNIVRWGFSPSKTFRLAKYAFEGDFDDETIYKWLKTFVSRFFAQQFKRSCLPDGPKVGSVDLSPRGGWRMPSDACRTEWIKDLESCDPEKQCSEYKL